jgi:hypothetical protein
MPVCPLLNIVLLAIFMMSVVESLISESHFCCNFCMLNVGSYAICAACFNHADTKMFYPT